MRQAQTKAALAAMLMDQDALKRGARAFSADDFPGGMQRAVFTSMAAMAGRGDVCDPLTLAAELLTAPKFRGRDDEVRAFIGELVDAAPHDGDWRGVLGAFGISLPPADEDRGDNGREVEVVAAFPGIGGIFIGVSKDGEYIVVATEDSDERGAARIDTERLDGVIAALQDANEQARRLRAAVAQAGGDK